jgi:inorganic pyrophosphatase
MIGQNINVYIDRPIGSTHPKYNDIVYSINYGYIKEIIAIDDEYQDVYVLGENEPIEFCKGVVYAVVERENEVTKCYLLILPLPFLVSHIGKVAETESTIFGIACVSPILVSHLQQ